MNTPRSAGPPKVLAVFAGLIFAAVFSPGALGAGPAAAPTKRAAAPAASPADILLSVYDKNHNGRLDREEILIMAQLQPERAAEAKNYDFDHNGMLDEEELNMWRDGPKLLGKTSVTTLLEMFDKDGDQKLEKTEIQRMTLIAPEKAAEAKKYDLDHNGMLDVAELQLWRDVIKAEAEMKASSSRGGG